jgi:hypothetical protein
MEEKDNDRKRRDGGESGVTLNEVKGTIASMVPFAALRVTHLPPYHPPP